MIADPSFLTWGEILGFSELKFCSILGYGLEKSSKNAADAPPRVKNITKHNLTSFTKSYSARKRF